MLKMKYLLPMFLVSILTASAQEAPQDTLARADYMIAQLQQQRNEANDQIVLTRLRADKAERELAKAREVIEALKKAVY
jgi:hypothetical protein